MDSTINSLRLGNASGGGRPLSTPSTAKKLLEIIRAKYSADPQHREFTMDEIKQMAQAARINGIIQDAVDLLNNQGYLLNIGSRRYRYLN